MKKIPWLEITLGAVVSFWFTIIIVKAFGFFGSVLGKLTVDNCINLIGIVVTLGAIFAVYQSTRQQIANQNKQSHRPYIIFERMDYKEDAANYGYADGQAIFSCVNAGYGVCVNIKVWHDGEFKLYEDVKVDGVFNIYINEEIHKDNIAIIFYSDLYGNIYSSLLKYSKPKARIYQANTDEYNRYTETVEYNKILEVYKKETGI